MVMEILEVLIMIQQLPWDIPSVDWQEKVASETILQDVNTDTVDIINIFDGSEQEAVVPPAKLPIVLFNVCAGIAVGMATNVPPLNLGELKRMHV